MSVGSAVGNTDGSVVALPPLCFSFLVDFEIIRESEPEV